MAVSPALDHLVLVGLDGLRPDLVSREVAPNLSALLEAGCVLANHRSVFPTETRVNLASLSTGAHTEHHGVVANALLHHATGFSQKIVTRSAELLDTLADDGGRRLFATDWLGAALARQGKSFAVVASGSAGSLKLLSWGAAAMDQIVVNPKFPELTHPDDLRAAVFAKTGVLQQEPAPQRNLIRFVADAFLDHVWPQARPAVSIVWFAEPDKSLHHFGPGSPEVFETVGLLDKEIGRLRDWHEGQPDKDRIGFIFLSDHGHVTVREKISVAGALRDGGFSVGDTLGDDSELAVVPGNAVGIWARNDDMGLLNAAFDLIGEQPWFGMGFSHRADHGAAEAQWGRIEGTFAHDAVFGAHPSAPPLRIVLRASDAPNDHGYAGTCFFDGSLGIGCGYHGGVHEKELTAFGLLYGAPFKSGHRSSLHSGMNDIFPTALHCLGLKSESVARGRVLHEAFSSAPAGPAPAAEQHLELSLKGKTQHLYRVLAGGSAYVDRGFLTEVHAQPAKTPGERDIGSEDSGNKKPQTPSKTFNFTQNKI